jgi:hypothetical protein
MEGRGFTAYHATLASALARQMAAYADYYESHFKRWNDDVELIREIEERRIVLIFLTTAYLEAKINVYLSLKMEPAQFELLENARLLDKWVTVPTLFLPKYEFPTGTELFAELASLIKRRNGIVHMKPEVTEGKKRIHKGNHPKAVAEHDIILKWVSLPTRLLQHLEKFDDSTEMHMLSVGAIFCPRSCYQFARTLASILTQRNVIKRRLITVRQHSLQARVRFFKWDVGDFRPLGAVKSFSSNVRQFVSQKRGFQFYLHSIENHVEPIINPHKTINERRFSRNIIGLP